MRDWVEVVAGEAEHKYRRAALVLRTLGWIGIVWAAMISIWLWMGAKAGSNLWLWSVIGLFVIGVVMLAIASRLQIKASRRVERPLPDNNGMKAA